MFKIFGLMVMLVSGLALADAAKVSDKKLGTAVLVQRTFTLDVEDCKKTYEHKYATGQCVVSLVNAPEELIASGPSTFFETDLGSLHLMFHATASGYDLWVGAKGVQELVFDDAKEGISKGMAALKNQATVYVHTVPRAKAEKVEDKVLGLVYNVKRTFPLSVDDCLKTYQMSPKGGGSCTVELQKNENGEVLAGDNYLTHPSGQSRNRHRFWAPAPVSIYYELEQETNGYKLVVNTEKAQSLDQLKNGIRDAFNALGNEQITFVHTPTPDAGKKQVQVIERQFTVTVDDIEKAYKAYPPISLGGNSFVDLSKDVAGDAFHVELKQFSNRDTMEIVGVASYNNGYYFDYVGKENPTFKDAKSEIEATIAKLGGKLTSYIHSPE